MTIPRGVAVELLRLTLQVIIVAAGSAGSIVYIWETTRSTLRTLIAAALIVCVARVLHSRYRTQRTRARGRFYLPMHYPKGSTAI